MKQKNVEKEQQMQRLWAYVLLPGMMPCDFAKKKETVRWGLMSMK